MNYLDKNYVGKFKLRKTFTYRYDKIKIDFFATGSVSRLSKINKISHQNS